MTGDVARPEAQGRLVLQLVQAPPAPAEPQPEKPPPAGETR